MSPLPDLDHVTVIDTRHPVVVAFGDLGKGGNGIEVGQLRGRRLDPADVPGDFVPDPDE
jgi:hypothetical protein